MSCVLVEGQKCDVRGSLSPTPDRYTGRCSCKVYYSLSPGVIADTCICSVSQLFATLHWHWSKTDPNKLIQKWQHKAHITMCCLLANNFEYTNRRACFNMLPQSASLPLFVGSSPPSNTWFHVYFHNGILIGTLRDSHLWPADRHTQGQTDRPTPSVLIGRMWCTCTRPNN